MGRRHLPVLLAARMQYRLRGLEATLHGPGIDQTWDELSKTWSSYGYVVEQTHVDLSSRIGCQVAGLGETLQACQPDRPLVQEQIRELDSLLKQL